MGNPRAQNLLLNLRVHGLSWGGETMIPYALYRYEIEHVIWYGNWGEAKGLQFSGQVHVCCAWICLWWTISMTRLLIGRMLPDKTSNPVIQKTWRAGHMGSGQL